MQMNRTELSRRLTGNGPIHHYGAPTSLPAGGTVLDLKSLLTNSGELVRLDREPGWRRGAATAGIIGLPHVSDWRETQVFYSFSILQINLIIKEWETTHIVFLAALAALYLPLSLIHWLINYIEFIPNRTNLVVLALPSTMPHTIMSLQCRTQWCT